MKRCIRSILLLGICFSTGFSCPLLDVLPADVLASCTNRLDSCHSGRVCLFCPFYGSGWRKALQLNSYHRPMSLYISWTAITCFVKWHEILCSFWGTHVIEILFLSSSPFSLKKYIYTYICWGTAILCSLKRLIHCMLVNELSVFLTEKYCWRERLTYVMGLLYNCSLE